MSARLEVIAGPMFSGKTEALIAALHRAGYSKKRVKIIKPAGDTRTDDFIASRSVNEDGTTPITEKLSAILIRNEAELLAVLAADDFDVLAVDEAQFFPLDTPLVDTLGWFGRAIRDLVRRRRNDSLRIIVAGLDLDYAENPFGPISGLLALADRVDKLTAVCMVCGADDAHLTQRLTKTREQIAVGDAGEYQARCRACFQVP